MYLVSLMLARFSIEHCALIQKGLFCFSVLYFLLCRNTCCTSFQIELESERRKSSAGVEAFEADVEHLRAQVDHERQVASELKVILLALLVKLVFVVWWQYAVYVQREASDIHSMHKCV